MIEKVRRIRTLDEFAEPFAAIEGVQPGCRASRRARNIPTREKRVTFQAPLRRSKLCSAPCGLLWPALCGTPLSAFGHFPQRGKQERALFYEKGLTNISAGVILKSRYNE